MQPTWSPDSRKILFLQYSDDYYTKIYNRDTGRVTTFVSERIGHAAWSPDGTMIAGTSGVWDALTTQKTHDFEGLFPRWLPDSNGLVYLGGDGTGLGGGTTIYLAYLDRLDQPIQITYDNRPRDHLDLTRDGSIIAYSTFVQLDGTYGLYSMPFRQPGLFFQNVSTSAPHLSKNDANPWETSFAINKKASVTVKIWDVNQTLHKTLLDNQPLDDGSLSLEWNGLGEDGIFVRDQHYILTLNAISEDGETAYPARAEVTVLRARYPYASGPGILLDDECNYATFSRTGDGYVVSIINLKTGDSRIIFRMPVSEGSIESISKGSQDDLLLVIRINQAEGHQIASLNIQTGGFTFITTSGMVSGEIRGYNQPNTNRSGVIVSRAYRLGPSGYYNHIVKFDSDGENLVDLISHDNQSWPRNPVWSPDEKKIAFQLGESYQGDVIMMMAKDGTGLRRITNPSFYSVFPIFSPEGHQILYGSDRFRAPGTPWDSWIEYLDRSQRYMILPNAIVRQVFNDGFSFLINNGEGNYIPDRIDLYQSITLGQVRGQIVVASGDDDAPVPGALVRVIDESGGRRETFTGSTGAYQILNLKPGVYDLEAAKEGYELEGQPASVVVHANKMTEAPVVTLLRLPDALLEIDRPTTHAADMILLRAEPTGGVVNEVAFDYSLDAGESWSPLGTADSPPFLWSWDAAVLVADGEEILVVVRATASDGAGKFDDVPSTLSLILDGKAPAAVLAVGGEPVGGPGMRVKSGAPIPIRQGSPLPLNASSSNADLEFVQFELRRVGEEVWRGVGSGWPVNGLLLGVLDTSSLVVGETYDLRARAVDHAGNVDPDAEPIQILVIERGPPSGGTLWFIK